MGNCLANHSPGRTCYFETTVNNRIIRRARPSARLAPLLGGRAARPAARSRLAAFAARFGGFCGGNFLGRPGSWLPGEIRRLQPSRRLPQTFQIVEPAGTLRKHVDYE